MSNLERLGHLVHDERVRQYRTVDRARAVAQISRGAWDGVEKGKPAKRLTYNSIETALGWDLGRCERILGGGEDEQSQTSGLAAEVRASNLSPEAKEEILRRIADENSAPIEPSHISHSG